jgi:hypothetical protein
LYLHGEPSFNSTNETFSKVKQDMGSAEANALMQLSNILKKAITCCALVAAFTHCVQPVKTSKIHPNCPEIPATTFEKVGLDATAGGLQFGKLITVGELTVKTDPQIISVISQSVRDDQITDALICAAKEG